MIKTVIQCTRCTKETGTRQENGNIVLPDAWMTLRFWVMTVGNSYTTNNEFHYCPDCKDKVMEQLRVLEGVVSVDT